MAYFFLIISKTPKQNKSLKTCNIYRCGLYLRHRNTAKPMRELTDKEWELIDTLRNYRKTYPKSIQLELYINLLVDELMEDD